MLHEECLPLPSLPFPSCSLPFLPLSPLPLAFSAEGARGGASSRGPRVLSVPQGSVFGTDTHGLLRDPALTHPLVTQGARTDST